MNTHPTELCAACGEPVDWSAGPHEFVRADGSTAVICADCRGIIAENTAPGEQGVHNLDTLGDGKGVHSVRTLGDEQGARLVSTPGEDDATTGKSATWPDGEPADVRDMARRHDLARRADNLAALLERDAGDVRDVALAAAVRTAIEAMRAFADACRGDDDERFDRALSESHEALVRCAALAAEVDREDA